MYNSDVDKKGNQRVIFKSPQYSFRFVSSERTSLNKKFASTWFGKFTSAMIDCSSNGSISLIFLAALSHHKIINKISFALKISAPPGVSFRQGRTCKTPLCCSTVISKPLWKSFTKQTKKCYPRSIKNTVGIDFWQSKVLPLLC